MLITAGIQWLLHIVSSPHRGWGPGLHIRGGPGAEWCPGSCAFSAMGSVSAGRQSCQAMSRGPFLPPREVTAGSMCGGWAAGQMRCCTRCCLWEARSSCRILLRQSALTHILEVKVHSDRPSSDRLSISEARGAGERSSGSPSGKEFSLRETGKLLAGRGL